MQTKSLYLAYRHEAEEFRYEDLANELKKHVAKLAIFKPIGCPDEGVVRAFSYTEAKSLLAKGEKNKLFKSIIKAHKELESQNDFVLCLGCKNEKFNINFNINTEVAKNLSTPYANVIPFSEELDDEIALQKQAIKESGCIYFASFAKGAKDKDVLDDFSQALPLLEKTYPSITTPSRFEFELFERAKKDKKTIVLPESEDERVLRASHAILEQKVANIILLGEQDKVVQKARDLGLNLDKAQIIDPKTSSSLDEYTKSFYELRKHKGLSEEDAKKAMEEANYFATMMVYKDEADGMVSGAVGTTADTIRPALQIIKTKPNISIVSSVFLMCLEKEVFAFGDCAVNPEPSAEHLAQIALSSAKTASLFGLEPKVALLSYSTGSSGSGEGVEKVKKALEITKELDESLTVDAPLQFDAAIDKKVASKKMPQSKVAGSANVFIFPDLNAGNIGYKAVQRTAKAVAIGPILQGLKKPVNDLSRGCLVEDIINTIAITAVQAQGE